MLKNDDYVVELIEKNKRYRKALEEIRDHEHIWRKDFYGHLDVTMDKVRGIAAKALEEE